MSIKNLERARIRKVRLDDAAAIWALEREIVMEGEFFIALPEEFNFTLEQQQEQILDLLENERKTMLVAEMEGKVVGVIAFKSENLIRIAHTGSITMMINKDCRNMGLGKLLLKELLEWADQNPFIEKVSLGVFSTNDRAIALYKKMGFVEEGRKIKEFKINDEYIDDILMCKFV
ncbi:MAG TPA: GNAT family protein [Bacillales bacterium]|nr:GNAT family protein [Bacillales bacterium]